MAQIESTYEVLGKGRKIIDGAEKITGRVKFTADQTLPGMLYIRPILSPYAHAKILSVDKSQAEQVPGVVAILTAQDLPTRDRVIGSRNSAILAKEKVLFRGQPVVAVVAESEAAAEDAAEKVFVDYEPLPAVIDLMKAAADDAPVVWPNGLPKEDSDLTELHAATEGGEDKDKAKKKITNIYDEKHFNRGDVEKGFAEADIILKRTYHTRTVHQTYMEPHAVVVDPDMVRGSLTIYTGTQGQFVVRDEVARILSLPKSKVKVVAMTLGGGFGAKYGIVEPLAAAVAVTVQRPVKMVLTRSEDFLTTTPSPATVIELKLGAKNDGSLTALEVSAYLDNGIFSFALSGIVAMLIGGYYKCDNVKIDCYEVITNKPQAGAYRAPGAPQATFALESTIDDLAEKLGRDPLELRLQNAAETGDPSGINQPWPSLGIKECLLRMQDHPAWKNRASKGANEGIGIAIGGWPCGVGPAASVCRVDSDGTVRITVGSVDISGVNSSLVLVAAEVFGVSADKVELFQGDTDTGPHAPASGGSQVTYSVAGAVKNAAEDAKRKLLLLAADHFEASVDDLEMVNGDVRVKGVPDRAISLGELSGRANSRAGGPGPIVGEGTTAVEKNAPGFVVHLAKVKVDPDTGHVDLTDFVAVQDVGFALNPMLVEGQIHGGVSQGIGWGLHEGMIYDDSGELLTATFMDYDMPKMTTVPNIDAVLVHNPSPLGPFGARGIGEPPITAPAAAIANAIKDATGVRVEQLPVQPETLWMAMHGNGSN
jgi:CO/xanthine dehydrogenase Mo-binding subunit